MWVAYERLGTKGSLVCLGIGQIGQILLSLSLTYLEIEEILWRTGEETWPNLICQRKLDWDCVTAVLLIAEGIGIYLEEEMSKWYNPNCKLPQAMGVCNFWAWKTEWVELKMIVPLVSNDHFGTEINYSWN